ncbi:MAG: Type secretory pathway VirB4 protein-like protein [Deltaproteobacteria bacterium]|nr:Type secretory pathway VirB4 protein-like protein [Deltaproteobacteria bacterium]
MVGDSYLILEKFEKARGIEIIQSGADGIDKSVMEMEVNKCAEFLKNITAQNVFIQFTTYFSHDVRPLLDEYMRLNADPVLQSMARENIQELRSNGGIIDTSLYCTIVMPLNAEASIEGKKKRQPGLSDFLERDRKLDEAIILLKDTLITLGYGIKDLTGAEMMQNISRIVNPDNPPPFMGLSECGALLPLRKRIFNTDFYSKDYYLTNGRYFFATLVVDTIPNIIPVECGSKILRNIDFPLVMNTTILCEDAARISKDLSRMRMMANVFSGKKTSAALENKEKIVSIDDLLQDRAHEGWKIVKCFNSYLIWDVSIETLQEKIQALRLCVSKAVDGAGVFAEWMRKENAFVASLPGCATRNYDPHIIFGHDILKFVPLRGMYRGDRTQPAILLRNRYGGVTALNPFSSRQNRWAGLVIGPTGSGKSVLTNGIIAGAMAYDPVIVIIDMSKASSYEPIVSNFGGSFIPVTFSNSDNRVNMFDLRVGHERPVGSKILSLNAIFTVMLSENGSSISKEALSIMERAIKRTYDTLFKEEPRLVRTIKLSNEAQETVLSGPPSYETYLEYRNYYIKKFLSTSDKKDFLLAEMAQCLATPTLNDFMRTLASDPAINTNSRDREIAEDLRRVLNLYAQGEQAALLNGVTNFTVERDIFCIHMGLVSERTEILALLLLLYRDFAYRKAVYLPGEMPPFLSTASIDWMLAAQKRPKLFVYDEFHNLKNNEPILDVLDKDARQQRTLGLATYLVTQDILDVAEKGKHFISHGYWALDGRNVSFFFL